MSFAKKNYIKATVAVEYAKIGVKATAEEVAARLVKCEIEEFPELIDLLELALEILGDAEDDVRHARRYFEANKAEGETIDEED